MIGMCPRERETVAAFADRRRARLVDDGLAAHVDICETCGEAALLARLMNDYQHQVGEFHVPAAGQVWWRAAVRARLEAVHSAARPLSWLNGVAGACATGLLLAVVGIAWPQIRDTAERFVSASLVEFAFREAAKQIGIDVQRSLAFVLIAGVFVLLAPVAIYFALSDD